nr:MAG TPA: hypothetical protein [Caudoviricetes sp.]
MTDTNKTVTHRLNCSTGNTDTSCKSGLFDFRAYQSFFFHAIGKLCPDTRAVSYFPTDYSPTAV